MISDTQSKQSKPSQPSKKIPVRRTGRAHPQQSPDLIRNGRRLALQQLDNLLQEPQNLETLRNSMQEAFDTAPLRFFEDFVMPNLPKQMTLEASQDNKAHLSITFTEEPDDLPQPQPE